MLKIRKRLISIISSVFFLVIGIHFFIDHLVESEWVFMSVWLVLDVLNIYTLVRDFRQFLRIEKLFDSQIEMIEEIESDDKPLSDKDRGSMHRMTNVSFLVMMKGNEKQKDELQELINNGKKT